MCQNSVLTSQLAFIPFSNKEFSFIRSLSFLNPECPRAGKLTCAALSSGGHSWVLLVLAVLLVFFSLPPLCPRGCDEAVVYKPAPAASGAPVRGAGGVDPCHSSRTFCVLVVKTFFR